MIWVFQIMRRKSVFGFAVALAFFVIACFDSYKQLIGFRIAHSLVEHTYKVIILIHGLDLNSSRLLAARQGYILTEEKLYLSKHREILSSIEQELQALQKLTADNQNRQFYIHELQTLISVEADSFIQEVQIAKDKDLEFRQKLNRIDQGDELLARIFDITRNIKDLEQGLLRSRTEILERQDRDITIMFIFRSLLAVLTLAVALLMLNQDISRRLQVEEQ